MTYLGTRPILPDELEQYELHHRARIAIKPGITGMWQVSGRSDITDFKEIVRLDTEYISEGYFYGIICTEHIDLMYQNYKQESLTKDMVVDNEILRDFDSNNEYYFKKYVNVNELDAEQLKEDIKQEINLLLQYH